MLRESRDTDILALKTGTAKGLEREIPVITLLRFLPRLSCLTLLPGKMDDEFQSWSKVGQKDIDPMG